MAYKVHIFRPVQSGNLHLLSSFPLPEAARSCVKGFSVMGYGTMAIGPCLPAKEAPFKPTSRQTDSYVL